MDFLIYPRSAFGPSGSGLSVGLLPRGLSIALGTFGGLGEWAFELIFQTPSETIPFSMVETSQLL